jgi:flagellar biosynthesis/type III secretory pathway protein FliH
VNELKLEGDPEVERGGCLVESEAGILDASLSTQLAALDRALLKGAADESEPDSEDR